MHSLVERTLWTVFANDMPMATFHAKYDAEVLSKKLNKIADSLQDVSQGRPIHWNIQSSQNFGTAYRNDVILSQEMMNHMFQFCFKKANYDQYQHILNENTSNVHCDWGLM